MDPSGDGGGGLTATGLFCGSCGTQLPPNSKFCNECGAPLTQATRSAEYKQVTVLFADVVHSMNIAAAVGAERLREIMAELVSCASSVVKRYGGTVDKFTGDGVMAVFGAPIALEDRTTLSAPVWRPGHSGGGEAACRRRPKPRRCRTAVADRLKLGPSDRR